MSNSNSAAQQIAAPERSYRLSVESQRLSPSGELGCYDQLTFRCSKTARGDLRFAAALRYRTPKQSQG
jgi:hypothetical protein